MKGFETKQILMWVGLKAERIANTVDRGTYSKRRAKMSIGLCTMLSKLDECGAWLTPEDDPIPHLFK
jgi:hypothetical protein